MKKINKKENSKLSKQFKKNPKDFSRIMIFGTFDMIHKGHENLFKQARALSENPYLIVSIARDKNVKKIKGKKPTHTETDRKKNVSNHSLVDKAVLGGIDNHIPHILNEKPDIIALGYDQKAYVKGLKTLLTQLGLKFKIIRLKPFKPKTYKTSILRKNRI